MKIGAVCLLAATVFAAASSGEVKAEDAHKPHRHGHHHHRHHHHSASSSRIESHQVPAHHPHHHHHHGEPGHCHKPKPKPCSSSSSSSSYHRPLPGHCSSSSSSSSSSSHCHHGHHGCHPHHHGCQPEHLKGAALLLTSQLESYLSACNFAGAEMLASLGSQARTIWHDCANDNCCVTQSTFTDYLIRAYGACQWQVKWLEQKPLSAVINADGTVSVTAVEIAIFTDNPTEYRVNQVEFIWGRSQFPAPYAQQHCGLSLKMVKSRSFDCGEIGPGNCAQCQTPP